MKKQIQIKETVSDFKAHIGFWLRLLSNHVSYSFAHKLEDSGVTVAEWVILREMYSNGSIIAPSKVASLTGLSRGAVSKLIDRLLHKKLVTRQEAGDDRRYQDVALTPLATKLVPKLAALADKNDIEYFSVLNKAEQKTLLQLLKKTIHHHKLTTLPTN